MQRIEALFRKSSNISPDTKLPDHSEIPDDEAQKWLEAAIGLNMLQEICCLTTVESAGIENTRVYGLLRIPLWTNMQQIDIPAIDPIPDSVLAQNVFTKTTNTGRRFNNLKAYATDEFEVDHLLAFLNKKSLNVPAEQVPEKFLNSAGIEPLQNYNNFYIGNHGGRTKYGMDLHLHIGPNRPSPYMCEEMNTVQDAIKFTKQAESAFHNIQIKPLSVDAYIRKVQNSLKHDENG